MAAGPQCSCRRDPYSAFEMSHHPRQSEYSLPPAGFLSSVPFFRGRRRDKCGQARTECIDKNSFSEAWLGENGSTGLATSGSGDTLAVILTAILAGGTEPALATVWSVCMHGEARPDAGWEVGLGPLGCWHRSRKQESRSSFPNGCLLQRGTCTHQREDATALPP